VAGADRAIQRHKPLCPHHSLTSLDTGEDRPEQVSVTMITVAATTMTIPGKSEASDTAC
jgi:hypothetical protein